MPIDCAKRWEINPVICESLKAGRYIACPLCGKKGFSLRGIQQHRCKKLPRIQMGKLSYHDTLSFDQIKQAIDDTIPF